MSVRTRRRFLIAAVIVVAAVASDAAVHLLWVRQELVAARAETGAVKAALVAADGEGLERSLSVTGERLRRVAGALGRPSLQLLRLVPVLGDNVTAVADLTDATAVALDAAAVATHKLTDGSGQLPPFAPVAGRFPVDELASVGETLQEASRELERASTLAHQVGEERLLPPVRTGQTELTSQLAHVSTVLRPAADLAAAMPSFLGAGARRRYFVAAQSPAELRGSGGVIGAYAILEAEDGRLQLSDFKPVQTLPNLDAGSVPPPNPDYAARYDRYGGAGFWLNVNMTPDFPSAASAILTLYEKATGERLDGVIAADPFALAELVSITGPVQVPGAGLVGHDEVVPLLLNRAYIEQRDPTERKRVLGDVAGAVLSRLVSGEVAQPEAVARAIANVAYQRRLLLFAEDPAVQAAFASAAVDGRLLSPEGSYIGIFGSNSAANKLDYYARRSLRYEVELLADGSSTGALRVDLHNAVPDEPLPTYVAGPFDDRFAAGESRTLLDVFCQQGCGLAALRRDGAPATSRVEHELGHPVFGVEVALQRGAQQRLDYRLNQPSAWSWNDGSATYRLTLQAQPTVVPTAAEVVLRVPAGMRITSATSGTHVAGEQARWRGQLVSDVLLELTFAPVP